MGYGTGLESADITPLRVYVRRVVILVLAFALGLWVGGGW